MNKEESDQEDGSHPFKILPTQKATYLTCFYLAKKASTNKIYQKM